MRVLPSSLLAACALPFGVLSDTVESTNPASQIKWTPCEGFANITQVQCGNLTVPLDYTNETDTRTITLNLIKNPSQTQPAPKGSILLNYGGPGADGINNFMTSYEKQRKYIGVEHDMISWDPRATRRTLPSACFNETHPNAAELMNFFSTWHDTSDVSAYTNWVESAVFSDVCYGSMQEFGQYVGMASTSRDMMAIVDALDEDGMLRYWGISGGTGLGSTVAAMFPERMDKVILDGVMNAHQYYHDLAETEWFTHSDDTFNRIMEACVELGPENCPLARHSCTSEELVELLDSFFEDLKRNPISSTNPVMGLGTIIDYTQVMNDIYTRLYGPSKYVYLVGLLDALLERNGTKYQEILAVDGASTPPPTWTDPVPVAQFAVVAIRCGDRFPRTDDPEEVEKALDISNKLSSKFGYFGSNFNAQVCAQWKFEAVERYDGDFMVRTNSPILFIGNTYDPATPIVSARNMSTSFEGSVVLEQESLGHVSFMTQESNCTRDAILDYFGSGKLPKNNSKCKSNLPLSAYVAGEFEGLDHV